MNRDEQQVRDLMIWLRDNEHHLTEWLPRHPKTIEKVVRKRDGTVHRSFIPLWTHFRFSGHGRSKKVTAELFDLAKPFFEPAKNADLNRSYYPNEKGLEIADGSIAEGFLEDGDDG